MTREHAHQLGMRHIWARILSVYGPDDNPNTMVMSLINKLVKGEKPLLTKGEQMWDYLYSGDAAKAFRLLGECGSDGKIYVLGRGSAKPLSEYMETIRDIVSPDAELGIGEIPYSDKQVMHLCADISGLHSDTGWEPETDFSDGIQKIVEQMGVKFI